jgi:hypothetical protein
MMPKGAPIDNREPRIFFNGVTNHDAGGKTGAKRAVVSAR